MVDLAPRGPVVVAPAQFLSGFAPQPEQDDERNEQRRPADQRHAQLADAEGGEHEADVGHSKRDAVLVAAASRKRHGSGSRLKSPFVR